MSLHLEFEPHSWYMGFAIRDNWTAGHNNSNLERPLEKGEGYQYTAYIDDGNTYRINEVLADTLSEMKANIREYHLCKHNGYGERIAKRRLNYLRGEIEAERISTGEVAELQGLVDYIEPGDILLLEWAGVPENEA